jgi:hypothetical protein
MDKQNLVACGRTQVAEAVLSQAETARRRAETERVNQPAVLVVRPVPSEVARLDFAAVFFIDERVLETSLKTAKRKEKRTWGDEEQEPCDLGIESGRQRSKWALLRSPKAFVRTSGLVPRPTGAHKVEE